MISTYKRRTFSTACQATLLVLFSICSFAQENSTRRTGLKKAILKDSLDGKFDLSGFLINAHGFIPVPQIITEPALGHFGLMFTSVFIKPNKVQVPSKYTPPDITAVFAGYTANNSWGMGALRVASLPKHHLKYRMGGGYGNVNLDYYRSLPVVGEQVFAFNFSMYGLQASVLRQIGKSDLYLGMDYLLGHNNAKPEFEWSELPDFVNDKDLDATLSSIGVDLELDKRDNVFTPNTGWYVSSDFGVNASWTGSDYDFQLLNLYVFRYFQFGKKWISGFRFETRQLWGDAPFYSLPAIALRGVPAARYQGEKTYVLETEQRFDFSTRWSVVAFTGLGKGITKNESFSDARLVYNYGTGFRYLIARAFKLRTGIDIAGSNEDFGWYIIFGSAWNRRN